MDFSYLISPMIFCSICLYSSILHKANILPHLSKTNNRYDYIDGLRGVAAILVVCSHSWRFRDIGFINDEITKADYFYIGNFGALGVQLFFCITGFLFFKKILKDGLAIDWQSFYLSRIRRLAPLYFSFCICVFVIGMLVSGINSVNSQAITSAAKLLIFGFMGTTFSIGSYNSGYITPILWTLPYEWKFYIAIPMIAAFLSTKKSSLVFISLSAVLYVSLSASDNFNIWIFFLSGGLAAFLERYNSHKLSLWMRPVFYLLATLVILSSFSHETDKYGVFRAVTTTLLFISITLCKPGILKLKGLVYAGEVSYGIYLFHLAIIYIFNNIVTNFLHGVPVTGSVVLLIVSSYCLLVTLLTSFTFKYIEYPFMRKP